ncbi:MAG: DUF3127 domain-containing protein [Bacteroidaceae bacterium]|nr:DUF3127 domain-containing protein [Bacteroidaceae bacterium]
MKIKGRIIAICQPKTGVSERTGDKWASQEYVIEYFEREDDQWPDSLVFNIFGEDKIKEADLHINDEIEVYVSHKARQAAERWFTSIRAGRITKIKPAVGDNSAPKAEQAGIKSPFAQAENPETASEMNADGEDLPF